MNHKMISLILLFTGFMMQPVAQEDVLQLSLEQAQEYAVEHNLSLQNAREDIRIAREQYNEARGQGLPQISAQLDYMTNFNYEAVFEFGGGESQTPEIDFTKLDAGDLEVLKLLQSMSASSSSTIKMTDQSNAQLQLSQLIFGGQYWVGLQTARIAEELARQSVSISEQDIRESVANTYYLILLNEEIINVLEQNIDNLETIRTHTENMYNAGLAEQTDVDQISVSLAELQNQKQSMDRNILLSYNMLRFQLGLESGREIRLANNFEDFQAELEAATALSQTFNLTRNPNYQIVNTQEVLQEKMVDMERWASAPTLTGFYSYTEKILTSGFDLNPNHAAGLTLSVPLFSSGMRQARLDKARIELEKARRNREIMEDNLLLQNNQLRYELTTALENYQTQKQNVDVAGRLLESMQNKYRQGLISSLDLTQANSNYLQAESNYLNAALQLMQADLKLDKLYNQL